MELMPDNDELRIHLSALYSNLGKPAEAKAALEEVLQAAGPTTRGPSSPTRPSWRSMGDSETWPGKIYEKLLRIDPKEVGFRVELARIAADRGDLARAEERARSGYLRSRPDDRHARLELARVRMPAARTGKAPRRPSSTWRRKSPDDPEVLLELSAVYRALGLDEKSVTAAERLVTVQGRPGRRVGGRPPRGHRRLRERRAKNYGAEPASGPGKRTSRSSGSRPPRRLPQAVPGQEVRVSAAPAGSSRTCSRTIPPPISSRPSWVSMDAPEALGGRRGRGAPLPRREGGGSIEGESLEEEEEGVLRTRDPRGRGASMAFDGHGRPQR